MSRERVLKTITVIALVIGWAAILTLIWWLIGPDGFWQKLVMIIMECLVTFFGACGLFFGSALAFDEIHSRKMKSECLRSDQEGTDQ